ncbi:MAG TPA: molybdopterin dinucleotide binding domain-containing protein, partial [Gemmatimonadales bacterium]|nr:molybdopterin dinucleotide binding domain-containing protein [Gemmatimonadales bacterium]
NAVLAGPGLARPSWEALEDLARRMRGSLGATSAAALAKEIETVAPAYRGITWDSLAFGAGREGFLAPVSEGDRGSEFHPTEEAPPPEKAGMSLHLARVLYDRGTLMQAGPSLVRLAPDPAASLHPSDAERLGVTPGEPVRLVGSHGEAPLPAALDDSLLPGTVYLPHNLGIVIGDGAAVEVTA